MTYSPDGEVLSVTVTEPRFTPEDVAILLASKRADSERRGAHGHLLSEATDERNRGKWRVPLPTADYAAQELHRQQKAYQAQYGKNTDMDALLWRVELED